MREIIGVYDAPRPHWVGDGFPVRSLLTTIPDRAALSPFLLLDYAKPIKFGPASKPRGVDVHPHRGFETVTIVYQGEIEHRDSTGNGGRIGPGDVQWMTAASGILHEEFHSREFTETGGTFEVVQLWVNLPALHKMDAPGYQTLLARDIPEIALADDAGALRVIAGSFDGQSGPARTYTPINIWDVRLRHGKEFTLDIPDGHAGLVAVLDGAVLLNGSAIVRGAQVALLAREGGPITLEANGDSRILVLSGEPIEEPIVAQGPFVMNTADEIREAVADFRAGRFGQLAH